MQIVADRLGQALLTTYYTDVHVAEPGTRSIIRSITVANHGTADARVWVYLAPDGEPADDTTVLVPGVLIPERGVGQDDAVHALRAGGRVVARSDTDGALTITVDGAVETEE